VCVCVCGGGVGLERNRSLRAAAAQTILTSTVNNWEDYAKQSRERPELINKKGVIFQRQIPHIFGCQKLRELELGSFDAFTL